jgi:hypothetical protein
MFILGIVDRETVIAQVDRAELKKFFNTYYRSGNHADAPNVDDLKVGDKVDLGRGFDFSRDIRDAVKTINATVQGAGVIAEAVGILQELGGAIADREEGQE